ncbi:threonine synthase [Natronobacterium gregoryi]|uniref:Threonine synthase n=2 Tax=Natronobacterium gregoryi TaxID=44930 RepID=L0AIJ4_NATGS|nr:threonine synthase [Natronobacterium gregoryi]AFZ73264.1 threonine synthase [Natronobacterium gregoryi SP2]ELY71277.1 threonine synthase [Natronobacterium gregoryi SP2]PLK18763.1 threonine synthase [Natronobacterium gregoryi SP2]SFJ64513.1 L-threonine synthase [Natronobacterium gregoryi]
METTAAFTGLECVDCGTTFDAAEETHRCPGCGGILDPTYQYDAIDLDRETLESRPFDSMWRYEELLPFSRESATTMDEGATPLVDCPALADDLGVGRVLIKDEGRNPTGTFKDRGQTVAVTAATKHGASDVVLASAGNAGQAASAYAGRAGLDSHVYLPSRSGFTNKAMVNVHGGDMNVVGGRIGDAGTAYVEAREENDDWFPLQTFVTPYRHEGKKTMFYEIVEQLDWEVPDAITYPTGGGVGLIGMYKAATEFRDLGLIDELPGLYAAQASGCAPIVEAFEEGRDEHDPVETPDTICGGLEIPDPGASPWVLEALCETDGGAVSTDDPDILQAGVQVAKQEGLEMCPSSAAAASGAWELAERGEFGNDDTVVILNTGAGNKEADVLRSHLMSQGV